MNTIELRYEEQSECSSDKFCSFVERNDAFSNDEINHLQDAILNKKLSRVLYVSTFLVSWSLIAAWVDAVILPFIIIYTFALPGAKYYPLLFPVAFTIVNAVLKFAFIHQKVGNAISLRDNFLAVLPYAGAAFLLKNWFVGDPLLRKASLGYIKHQKKSVVQKVLNFLKGK
jgi:hypothetical protein